MPLPKKIPRGRPVEEKEEEETKALRVLANRYQVQKKLGSGNFGTAFLVKDLKVGGEMKVLKEIAVGDLQPDETVDAMHEARLLSKLDHPGIVKFHDSFIDGEFFCIITEYCEGGDLGDIIAKVGKTGKALEEKLVIEWFIQLLLAVQYMHSRKVLHRDLKTRNIFLKNNMIKIGDFGISRILMGTSDLATTFTGTPYYMSPEVLKHEGYNSKSDVWSIACILYELCSSVHAFEGQSLMGVMYKIVEGNAPEWPAAYSGDLGEVFKAIMVKDPAKRPSATDVTKIPFVARHIQKLKNTFTDRRHAGDLTINPALASKEADEIHSLLNSKARLVDLKAQEEENKWKNMSPRERMRLRKQQKSDEAARKLQMAAQKNLEANLRRKEQLRRSMGETQAPPWVEDAQEKPLPVYKVPDERLADVGYNVRPQSAPVPEPDEVDDEFDMYASYGSKTSPATMVPRELYLAQKEGNFLTGFGAEDRPITPLKDKMIYDPVNSSLDFKDGIPENADLANTYYSQYDDFEKDDEDFDDEMKKVDDNEDDDDDGVDDEDSLEELESVSGDESDDDNDRRLSAGDSVTDNDYDALISQMEDALEVTNVAAMSMTVHDDTVAGAFGPSARNVKIKNLRTECEMKLGKKSFKKAYEYLREKRFAENDCGTLDETIIMAELRQWVKNPSDCFLVDQLLFLEEQAKIAAL